MQPDCKQWALPYCVPEPNINRVCVSHSLTKTAGFMNTAVTVLAITQLLTDYPVLVCAWEVEGTVLGCHHNILLLSEEYRKLFSTLLESHYGTYSMMHHIDRCILYKRSKNNLLPFQIVPCTFIVWY